MKILYGVQGTGNGHISRARIMARAFAKRDDVQVDYLFSGREPERYFDMELFGQFRTLHGLSFVTERGEISHFKSIKGAKLLQLYKDIRQLDLSGYDLILNDFEPITAWAARYQNKPSISISHQAAFSENIPQTGNGLIERTILKYYAPTEFKLGVHWYHFGFNILPPFIEQSPKNTSNQNYYLVYLPFEAEDEIKMMLEPLSEHNFICFHPSVSKANVSENISWFPLGQSAFHKYLNGCTGVITNCGFELTSECLQLGKSLLVKPLGGQFEQLSNAMTLDKLGLCQTMLELSTEAIESWLESASKTYVEFPQDPHELIEWILERKWHQTTELCKSLWEKVIFPPEVKRRLTSMALD